MEKPGSFDRAQLFVERKSDKVVCEQRTGIYRQADHLSKLLEHTPKWRPIFSSATAFERKKTQHQTKIDEALHYLDQVLLKDFEYNAEQTRIAAEARDLRLSVEEETGWGGGEYAVQTIEGVLNGKNIRIHAKGMYHESWHGGQPRPWTYIGFVDETAEMSPEKAERIFMRYARVLHDRNSMEDKLNGATRSTSLRGSRDIFAYFEDLKKPTPFLLKVRKAHGTPTV